MEKLSDTQAGKHLIAQITISEEQRRLSQIEKDNKYRSECLNAFFRVMRIDPKTILDGELEQFGESGQYFNYGGMVFEARPDIRSRGNNGRSPHIAIAIPCSMECGRFCTSDFFQASDTLGGIIKEIDSGEYRISKICYPCSIKIEPAKKKEHGRFTSNILGMLTRGK